MAAPERRASAWPHILILLAFCALFTWLFSRFFLRPLYLAESDLYENGLPIYLSPVWIWSSFEFSGLPVLADPANFTFYPPNMLCGELLHSWTAVVVSAPLLAACFTYAYAFSLTRSRTAAIFSALAYSLSEDMLERLRHLNHVHAIAWLPLILLSIDRVRGHRPRLWIFDPQGAHLGIIPMSCGGLDCQGVAFGGTDKKTLYVAGHGELFRIAMLAQGFMGRAK